MSNHDEGLCPCACECGESCDEKTCPCKECEEHRLHTVVHANRGMNPKQLFTVTAVSRKDIAKLLNQDIDSSVDSFKSNDPRLTDKVCRKIASLLYEMTDTDEDDDGPTRCAIMAFLRKMPKKMRRR